MSATRILALGLAWLLVTGGPRRAWFRLREWWLRRTLDRQRRRFKVITTDGIKAIFFMLAPGEKAPAPEGRKVRVTFRDGRQVAGYSPDYREGAFGFFMIPADTRTNTGRIWVYQAAVRQVAIS